jgi:hypothetical protein
MHLNESDRRPLVSVLVLVSERAGQLDDLYSAYAAALKDAGWSFEFIFAADPGYAAWVNTLRELRERGEPIRIVEVAQSVGEATLLRVAAARASGELLLSVPAYWRIEPASVPILLKRVMQGADMAVARRWPRTDSWVNRWQNRAFHRLVKSASGKPFRDIACGIRAFRPSILDEVPLYGDFHRFFPLLADRAGFRVEEVSLPQHPADVGPRVYSPGIYLRRILDLLGIFFLLRFTNKPLRFFGLVGSSLTIAGAVVLAVLSVQRMGGQGIADRPMLLLGVLLVALGVQAIALGLIGEIIVFLTSPAHPPYRIARDAPVPHDSSAQADSAQPEIEVSGTS